MKSTLQKRFVFAPYSSKTKTTCPSCGRRKHFTRLIDTETNRLLPIEFGYCDSENKCTYKRFPKKDEIIGGFEDINIKISPEENKDYYNTIPLNILNKSLNCEHQDNFSKWLISLFGERAKKILSEYKIGCHGKYYSTIFWQIDNKNNIRSGKIMTYNIKTGKRYKDYTNWIHTVLKIKNYSLEQCLYGLHLINKYPNKKICICEGEKNALVLSILHPEYLWLATGSIHSNMNEISLGVLEGKDVIFYPDKGRANDTWKRKLKSMTLNFKYKVSDVLEYRDDLEDGDDLVDMVLKDKNLSCNKF